MTSSGDEPNWGNISGLGKKSIHRIYQILQISHQHPWFLCILRLLLDVLPAVGIAWMWSCVEMTRALDEGSPRAGNADRPKSGVTEAVFNGNATFFRISWRDLMMSLTSESLKKLMQIGSSQLHKLTMHWSATFILYLRYQDLFVTWTQIWKQVKQWIIVDVTTQIVFVYPGK